MDDSTRRRLTKNEVIFRAVNEDAQDFIRHTKGDKAQLDFYCECSHRSCTQRITLSTEQYANLHGNKRQFIAIDGHELPEIEKIVSKEDGYNVIEKYSNPPGSGEIKSVLRRMSA